MCLVDVASFLLPLNSQSTFTLDVLHLDHTLPNGGDAPHPTASMPGKVSSCEKNLNVMASLSFYRIDRHEVSVYFPCVKMMPSTSIRLVFTREVFTFLRILWFYY